MSDTDTTPKAVTKSNPAHQLGAVVTAKPGAVVTRPDGTTHVVSGEGYVLDGPGTFFINGARIDVAVEATA